MTTIAVFGLGYVGCVTAACLGRDGHPVLGVEINPDKVAEVNSGHAPIYEPGLTELVQEQVQAGRLLATNDVDKAVRGSEVALITVGTPSEKDGGVSSQGVEMVLKDIGAVLRRSGQLYTVVVRSTLLPGILEERLTPMLHEAAGRPDIALCNNPEFLREGSAIRDYDNPPFVLVGADAAAPAQKILDLYRDIAAEKIITDTRTAALVKYACNAFHALKVAFANEIGSVAKSLGADGHEVMDLVCRDHKLNISPAYLRPGFAFGGSCLPKDLRALMRYIEQHALRLELLPAILPSNEAHLRRALKLVQESGHRTLGVIGLSFKAGTDDLRESPLVILVETLLGRGYHIKIYDPNVLLSQLRGRNLAYVERHLPHLAALMVSNPKEVYQHASLLVLGSDVAESLDWRTQYTGDVLDLRRDLARTAPSQAEELERAGTRIEPTSADPLNPPLSAFSS
ncbi:MAG TPA: nucleotide sugar dehydrogenase [Gemmataceae bacterium]|nr:nucleotide sugar dehydrogenase [Gemmataceae bacterium]